MSGFSSHKKVPEMPVVREPTYSFTNLARSMNGLGQPIKKTNETAAMHSVMGTSIDFLKKHSQNCAAMLEKLKDNVETDNNAKAVAFAYCNLAMQYMQSESIWKKHEQEFKIAYTKADESEKNSLLVEYQNWLQAYNNYANVFVQYYTDPFSKESEKKFSEVIVACNVTSASFARASSGVEIAVPAQAKQDMKAQMRETSPKGEGNVGAGEASIVYYINSHLAGLFGKIVVLTADKDVTYLLGGRKGIAVMPESP